MCFRLCALLLTFDPKCRTKLRKVHIGKFKCFFFGTQFFPFLTRYLTLFLLWGLHNGKETGQNTRFVTHKVGSCLVDWD